MYKSVVDRWEREMEQLEHYEGRWNWRLQGGEEQPTVSGRPCHWGHGEVPAQALGYVWVCGYSAAGFNIKSHECPQALQSCPTHQWLGCSEELPHLLPVAALRRSVPALCPGSRVELALVTGCR